jgi:asparagine synthase (glutamine-hydrolysing)
MCGIYGSINNPIPQFRYLQKTLNHRGPDGADEYKYKNTYLFHSRLAIQDLSIKANQPFHYKHYTIIYNGEIYNHKELRKLCNGFDFQTESDTETLIALFEKYNNNLFEFLDGMFAFCILDKKKNKLLLARDRAGKKPLYIYQFGDNFIFSSELNAIKTGIKNIEINDEAIQAYLRAGFFYKTTTPYKYVNELEAGMVYEVDINSLKTYKTKYYEILDDYNKPNNLSFEETLLKLDITLHRSVKDRLESSDLEVGAFLSGGIDSSLVVALASQYTKNLKTFTVKFDGAYDESSLAKLTASKYGTDHHELNISMNLRDDVEKIILNYGAPFMDSSAVPSYYVSQEAKKYVTVILNGDGADELFGGYRRYVPAANGLIFIANKLRWLLKVLPRAHNKKSLYNYFYRLLAMSGKKGLEFYLSSTSDIFEDIYQFDQNRIIDEIDRFVLKIQNSNLSKLNQMLYSDFNLLLFSDLLIKMDIATMAHSIEGRSPFLSKYMLEFVPSIKDNFKIKGTNTKHILRELSKKYLPTDIIYQPKRGFEVPLVDWVEGDLKDNIFDALDKHSYSSKFISQSFIDSLLRKKINTSNEKRAKILWSMYCLDVWKNNYDKHTINVSSS